LRNTPERKRRRDEKKRRRRRRLSWNVVGWRFGFRIHYDEDEEVSRMLASLREM